MKPKTALRHFLVLAGSSLLAISSAQAADGTWTQTATTQGDPAGPLTWSETTNWQDEIVAGGTDATAFFTVNPSAAQTVTLDTDVTLGNLTLNRNQNLTIVPDIEDPKTLTLDVTTGTPLLSLSAGRILSINSPVAGNDGLEVTGGAASGGVALAGTNTFTGGIFLNNGSLGENNGRTTQSGLNDNHITVAGTSYACFAGGTQITGGVEIPAGSQFRAGTNNSNFAITGALTGSGTLTHQQYGLGNQRIDLLNTNNTFTGNLDYDMPRNATTIVNSLGDDGRVRFGLTNFLNNQDRQHVFEFGSGGDEDLVFDQRQFEILGSAPTTTPRPNAAFEIRSNNANHALIINTDLINSHTGTETNLRFSGSGNQANTFAGIISEGPGNGTDPDVLNIFKLNGGTWIFSGDNTYTGTTTVSAGTLIINGDQSLATGAVAVNSTSTLGGSGTLGGSVTVAAGANLAPGASVGTLSIGGDLNISAMAGGAGKLFHELGSIAASDKIAVSGTLDIGTDVLGFGDFDFTHVGGLEEGVYTLITSGGISGSLDGDDLLGTIGETEATLGTSGNNIILTVGAPSGTPFELWAGSGVTFDGDENGDGVSNGLAFLLGAADPDVSALDKLPTVTESAGGLVLNFQMLDDTARGGATLAIEHSSDLGIGDSWTTVAVPDASGTVDDVVFTISGTGPLNVTATIPVGKADAGKLFGRLKAENP